MDIGVEFEHYRVIEHIGRGGMADVWSARDKRLNRIVAIKTVARDLTMENDPLKMFRQEAQTIAGLEHPHILPVYDFGEYDRRLYIVMRYISGGSLDDVLELGPLQPTHALSMARAIGDALDHAHRNNVVHLDLKPSNILLDSQGSPYLADFGLASVMDREGRALNPGSGTLLYMAPEQVTSDLLDHRADIYSFCILLFHMFTGGLPFEARMPLALGQLQMAEEMPDVSQIQFGLPHALTLLLRRGTMVDIERRPTSVGQIVDELEAMMMPSIITPVRPSQQPSVERIVTNVIGGATVDLSNVQANPPSGMATGGSTLPLETAAGLEKREAMDIYNRARRAWAFGQGRFVLGITDFTFVNDYYSRAELNNLELDDAGMQMFLRGALEYDVDIDFWWKQLGDESRRWVAIHAVRGPNAAARVRALERLEMVADSDPPQIPRQVAQALQNETGRAGKLAAIQVLAARAAQTQTPTIESSGSPSQTRATASIFLSERLKLWTPGEWRETVYGGEVDTVLATTALDTSDPVAAEAAARAIGRIRSLTALRFLAAAENIGSKGSLKALALVRDEAPSLPGVSSRARVYAWLANTWRRLSERPIEMVVRFLWAFLGAALGIGYYAWSTLNSGTTGVAVLNNQNIALTVSLMLFFGVGFGLLVVFAGELPARLHGFWPWWGRLLMSLILGVSLATGLFGLYTFLFLNFPPVWGALIPGGLGLTAALLLSAVYRLPGWALAAVMTAATFIPIYIANQNYWSLGSDPILYFRQGDPTAGGADPALALGLPMVLFFAISAFAVPIWRELRRLWTLVRARASAAPAPAAG